MGLAAAAGIAAVGTIGGSLISYGAAGKAADASAQATQMSIAEQRAAREQLRKLLQPWVTGGQSALARQMGLLGLGGRATQQEAIDAFARAPMFQGLVQQGENAILQNASATGGLRGGNVQGALAQFRPALLNQQIQQQYANLAGLSQMGQNSAAGVGSAGMTAAGNIGNLAMANATNQGNAAIAQGNALGQGLGSLAGTLGGLFAGSGPITASTIAGLTPSAINTIGSNPGIF